MAEEGEEIKCLEHLSGKSSKIVVKDEVLCAKVPNKESPPLFILGFTGVGLIGTIVANELIEQLKMRQIGYILSEDLPPITLFYEGQLKHPFRVYFSEEFNLVVSICEVPFVPGNYRDLARTLMSWALEMGLRDIICLQGMADPSALMIDSPYPVYAAGEKEILEKIQKHDVQIPPKGLIMGAEAAILNECLNNQLNGAIFLTPAAPKIPTPEGAAAILERIAKIYNFPISLEKLEQQANEIRRSLMELAEKADQFHNQGDSRGGLPSNMPLYS